MIIQATRPPLTFFATLVLMLFPLFSYSTEQSTPTPIKHSNLIAVSTSPNGAYHVSLQPPSPDKKRRQRANVILKQNSNIVATFPLIYDGLPYRLGVFNDGSLLNVHHTLQYYEPNGKIKWQRPISDLPIFSYLSQTEQYWSASNFSATLTDGIIYAPLANGHTLKIRANDGRYLGIDDTSKARLEENPANVYNDMLQVLNWHHHSFNYHNHRLCNQLFDNQNRAIIEIIKEEYDADTTLVPPSQAMHNRHQQLSKQHLFNANQRGCEVISYQYNHRHHTQLVDYIEKNPSHELAPFLELDQLLINNRYVVDINLYNKLNALNPTYANRLSLTEHVAKTNQRRLAWERQIYAKLENILESWTKNGGNPIVIDQGYISLYQYLPEPLSTDLIIKRYKTAIKKHPLPTEQITTADTRFSWGKNDFEAQWPTSVKGANKENSLYSLSSHPEAGLRAMLVNVHANQACDMESAIDLMTELDTSLPPNFERSVMLARLYKHNNQDAEIENVFNRLFNDLIELDRPDDAAWYTGTAYAILEQPQKAVSFFEQGHQQHPSNFRLVSAVTHLYGVLGEFEKSINLCSDIIGNENSDEKTKKLCKNRITRHTQLQKNGLKDRLFKDSTPTIGTALCQNTFALKSGDNATFNGKQH